ncbi:hypothetical protein [Budvicia aquatica]|uniref:Uncharacterized protein n=1 Tax=Budvicia aquatica TaxID=82979 RepID=A0A2C6DQT4_9GAMM|nr:hypothetical protein [Budvicia aquatica]PHI31174.1 hypothetical protein CRN84_18425 [Budvicia aquatica]VFS51434.1 Uncharacterised protein [Budvicia aquatica]
MTTENMIRTSITQVIRGNPLIVVAAKEDVASYVLEIRANSFIKAGDTMDLPANINAGETIPTVKFRNEDGLQTIHSVRVLTSPL